MRARVGNERAVMVIHVDQPANDFNTLFDVLHSDPETYSKDDPNVFPSAIGRSFYENVFPRDQVALGWCSYAAVWLSRIPALIPGHFVHLASTGDVRAAFEVTVKRAPFPSNPRRISISAPRVTRRNCGP